MHMARDRRRELIAGLLRSQRALSQDELVEALAEQGESATQATVSRDLAALGALKSRDGYYLPELAPPGIHAAAGSSADRSELLAILRRHLVSAKPADSLIVLRTAPAHAGVVASAFDHWPIEGIVGTIAGDDTIFLAASSPKAARRLADELNSILNAETAA